MSRFIIRLFYSYFGAYTKTCVYQKNAKTFNSTALWSHVPET